MWILLINLSSRYIFIVRQLIAHWIYWLMLYTTISHLINSPTLSLHMDWTVLTSHVYAIVTHSSKVLLRFPLALIYCSAQFFSCRNSLCSVFDSLCSLAPVGFMRRIRIIQTSSRPRGTIDHHWWTPKVHISMYLERPVWGNHFEFVSCSTSYLSVNVHIDRSPFTVDGSLLYRIMKHNALST